jgi:hypothetical protein
VFVEISFGVGCGAFGLLEEDQLRAKVAIVLVIDDWPLEGELHVVHEGLTVSTEVSMRVSL